MMTVDPMSVAKAACRQAGLDPAGLSPVRLHSNAVFVLPALRIVVRVGRGADAVARARRAITATRWLSTIRFPSVEPASGIEQPIVIGEENSLTPVTFWKLVDVSNTTSITGSYLGQLLAQLHALRPPFTLPRFRPLQRLAAAVSESQWLARTDRRWIERRVGDLEQELDQASTGETAMVHGDAQLDNLIPTAAGPVLADWDNVAKAPPMWDLIPAAAEQRFGARPSLLTEVLQAYGADPRSDPAWAILLEIYELRSVAAHIRMAPISPPHAREAMLRIASLRTGDRCIRWSSVG